jgi:hypothetical protein
MLDTKMKDIVINLWDLQLVCDVGVHGKYDISMGQSVELDYTGTLRSSNCGLQLFNTTQLKYIIITT